MFDLEQKINEWKNKLRDKGKFLDENILELEGHLRDDIENLTKNKLTDEEAFIIALKRIGDSDLLSKEFSKVNTDVIWKNLIFYENDENITKKILFDSVLLAVFILISYFFSRIPEFFGYSSLFKSSESEGFFYLRIIWYFFMPVIGCFFMIKKFNNISTWQIIVSSAVFAASLVVLLFFPMVKPFHTSMLTGLHVPLFLWAFIGLLYTGKNFNKINRRMDFIRFTGEFFIYAVLLLCGIFVITALTISIFSQIEIDIDDFYMKNIFPFLFFGTPIVAVYLVEAKKSIVENIAPILAKIFSPVFLITMIVFFCAILFFKVNPSADRNFLITFNLMLILTAGLVTYIISSKKNKDKINFFDYMNIMVIVFAAIIDVIALSSIITRISKYGFSANKIAALGENIVLLVDLAGLFGFYVYFFIKKNTYKFLEMWQTFYLNIIFVWCFIVAFIFPIIFKFK